MSLFMSAINNEYRDRGKPVRDPMGLTLFFLQKNTENGLLFMDASVYRIPD